MGCLSYKLTRVGGITTSMTEVGCGMTASLSPYGGGLTASLIRKHGGISASFKRIGGMTCRMGLVCSTGFRTGIIWASDGRLITLEGGFLIGAD